MVNSKRKGQNFENTVYNALLKLGYSVKKPLGSGGQVEPGDIIINVGDRIFCLECKRYRHISMNQRKSFWNNHRFRVSHYNKEWIPVLVMKLDRHKPEVIVGDGRGGTVYIGDKSTLDDFLRYLGGIK